MKTSCRSDILRASPFLQAILYGISAVALALGFASSAHAAVVNYNDLATADGAIDTTGNTVTDFVFSGSTYNAVLSGNGAFAVNGLNSLGPGVNALTMSAANTFSGVTTILNNGVLILDATGTLASSSTIRINEGSVFEIDASKSINNLADGLGDAGHAAGGGSVVLGGTLTDVLTGDGSFSGVISGAGGLTTSGAFVLSLTGVNTYTGATTIGAGGTLAIDGSDTIATTSQVNMGAGTTLRFDDDLTLDRNIVQTGAATLNTNGNDVTESGNITGAQALTKSGAGTLTLSGTNAFTTLDVAAGTVSITNDANLGSGAVTLDNTTLQVTGTGGTIDNNIVLNTAGTLTLTAANSDTFSGVISGTNLTTNTGSGTMTLSGNNTYTGTLTVNTGKTILSGTNAYTGGTVVNSAAILQTVVADLGTGGIALNAGTLSLTDNGSTLSQNITLTGGGTLDVATGNSDTFSGVVGGAGGLNVGISGATGTVVLSGVNTYIGGTNINFGGLSIGAANNLGTGTVSMANGTTFTTSAGITVANAFALTGTDTIATGANNDTFSGAVTGTGNLTKTGSGTLTLSNAGNTYSGGTTLSAGGISVGANGNLGTGTVAMANGTNVTFTGADTFTQAFSLTGTDTLALGANNETLSGLISGAGTLTKTGSGTLTLSNAGNSAATFATTLSAGGLSVGAATMIGTGAVTMANGTSFTMTGSDTFTNAFALTGTDTIAIGANNDTLSGAIAGAGTLTKTGSGTLTLSNVGNNFSGGLDVTAGTVSAASDANLGTGTITLHATTLDLTGNTTIDEAMTLTGGGTVNTNANTDTISSVIAGTGTFTKTGAGILELTGVNTYSDATLVNAGTLKIDNGGGDVIEASSSVTLAGTAVLDLAGGEQQVSNLTSAAAGTGVTLGSNGQLNEVSTADTTFAGVISGSGGILSVLGVGSHVLTLSNTNTYTGATLILAGGTLDITKGTHDTIAASSTVSVASGAKLDLVNTDQSVKNLIGANSATASVTLGSGTLTDNTTGATNFSGVISGTGGFTVNGTGTLTLGRVQTYTGLTTIGVGATLKAGVDDVIASSGDPIVNGTFDLNDTSQSVNDLTGSGLVTNSGVSTASITNNLSEDGVWSGVIANGSGTGTSVAVVDNSGGTATWTLSGTNTYTGTTNIGANAHVLATVANTIANSVGVSVDGVFNLNNTTQGIINLSGAGSIITGGSSGFVSETSNSNTTFSGVISGAGGLLKTGASRLELSGVNTYTGLTSISNGTLRITGAGGQTIADSSSVGVSGTAILDLNNTNQTVNNLAGNSGTQVTLGSGILTENSTILGTYAGVISGTGGLIKTGASILTLSGANTYTGGTTISAGTLSVASGGASGSNLSTGTVAMANGSTLVLTGTTTIGNAFALTGTDTINNATANTLSGGITGTGLLNKTGAGVLTLSSGVSNFSGGINVAAGTVSVGLDVSLGTGTITLNATELDLTGNMTMDELLALNGGGTVDTNANTDTISSVISGTGGLTKAGSGTLVLSGANTYTGGTNINAGILSVASGGAAGSNLSTGTVNMANGSTLILTGTTTIGNAFALTGTDTVNNATANTLSGAITGTGLLTKTGAGILTLSNAGNTFSGGLNVSAGTVSVGSDANLGTGTITLNNTELDLTGDTTINELFALNGGGTVDTNSNIDTISGVISGTGPLTKAGLGTLTLSGSNTYDGGTNINAGVLSIGSADNLGSGTVAMANTTTLNFTGSDMVANAFALTGTDTINTNANEDELSGLISGTGSLTKIGSGTLILSNDNTYTGATNVNAGTLQVDGDQSAATGTTTVGASGTLSGTGTLGGDLINNGLVSPGHSPGVLTVAGDFSGSGTLEMELTGRGSNSTPSGTAGTHWDQVAVGGNATLSSQTLVLAPLGVAPQSKYIRGTVYPILTTGGTVNSAFANFAEGDVVDADSTGDKAETAANIASSDNDLLAYRVNYDSDQVNVKIVRAELFADSAETPNQRAVAEALDSIQETATGDMETLLNGLSGSSDQASDLKFLSGENNANLQKSTAEAMHAFNGLLGKRLGGDCNTADYLTNPASSPRAKMGNTGSAASNYAFACGYGQFSKVQANGGAGAVESTLAGGAAGVEIRPTSPSVVRFGIGYARDDMELKSTSDTTTVNSIQAGVYAQHDLVEGREGKAYVGATLSGGYNMADTERHVVAGPIVRIAKGDVSGYNLSAGALLGALFRVGNVNIEPIASAEYIYNNQDSYTESGAGAGNLSVSGRETNLLRSSAGGQVNAVLPVGRDMTMVPQVHGAFIYDALDVNPGIHQSIGGAGFNVKGARPGRMGYEAGGGLTLNVNKKLSLFGDYNGTFRDHETDHSFLGGLKVNW